MQIRRKLFAVVLALSMLFGMAGTVSAFSMQDATEYIQQILNYYRYYQDDAATDIDCLLYAMSHNNPYKEQDWSSIMDYWHYVNTDMTNGEILSYIAKVPSLMSNPVTQRMLPIENEAGKSYTGIIFVQGREMYKVDFNTNIRALHEFIMS